MNWRIAFQKIRMIQNPTSAALIILFLGVTTFIIMFLPALLELKKPKDAGPRRIMNHTILGQVMIRGTRIINLEEEQHFEQNLVKKLAEVTAALLNLEA